MIAALRGYIEEIGEDGQSIVLDVNGVGYEIMVSPVTASEIAGLDSKEELKLYTYLQVREDAMVLFGFMRKDELQLFKKLITVSGIGPKGGLALLSMGADSLRFAIASGDVKTISKAPGVGKKTAERLVLELKDKIEVRTFEKLDDNPFATAENIVTGDNTASGDAVEALAALGYSRTEAVKAVNSAAKDGAEDTEALLKGALKYLM